MPSGHNEYLIMPFSLTNDPAGVNDVPCDMLNCELDEILIFSESKSEHIHHLQAVLQRLLENLMYVKAEKCKFHSSPVSFLRFGVTQGTLQMDPAKVPEICKQLQRLLTLSLYPRLRHAGSSTSLKVLFSWTPATSQAFVSSKAPFISAPVLNFPDLERQFRVEVDASNVGVGRLLSQRSAADQNIQFCSFFLSVLFSC